MNTHLSAYGSHNAIAVIDQVCVIYTETFPNIIYSDVFLLAKYNLTVGSKMTIFKFNPNPFCKTYTRQISFHAYTAVGSQNPVYIWGIQSVPKSELCN